MSIQQTQAITEQGPKPVYKGDMTKGEKIAAVVAAIAGPILIAIGAGLSFGGISALVGIPIAFLGVCLTGYSISAYLGDMRHKDEISTLQWSLERINKDLQENPGDSTLLAQKANVEAKLAIE